MKLVSDGSISERTAHLSQPYEGRPNDRGIQVMPEEELYSWARKAHAAGWQIGLVPFVSWLVLLLIAGTKMARDPRG